VLAKDEVTFTKNSFKDIFYLKNPVTLKWVAITGMKGSVSAKSSKMTISLTSIGMTSYDGISGLPTGLIQYYEKGTDNFQLLLEDSGYPAIWDCDFTVAANKLTLYMDTDGDFIKEGYQYTKQ
jgi:hypothetical protein